MLEESRLQLDDHNSGRRLLEDDEKIRLEKKIDVFARKLETMKGELDDREIERLLKREEIRNERTRELLQRREERRGEEL